MVPPNCIVRLSHKPLPIIPPWPRDSTLDLTRDRNLDHVPGRANFSPYGMALPRGTVTPRPSVTLLKAMKSIPRRIRSVLPVRAAGNRGNLAALLDIDDDSTPTVEGLSRPETRLRVSAETFFLINFRPRIDYAVSNVRDWRYLIKFSTLDSLEIKSHVRRCYL